jgi:hypothetical protein
MSFKAANFLHSTAGPLGRLFHNQADIGYDIFKPKTPPPPPGVPNPNDAANAAQGQTDQLRARRGMLANIYGGAQSQQPVSGKIQLG